MTDAVEALAVALWERDPDMSAPSDALEEAKSILAALEGNGLAIVPREPTEACIDAIMPHTGFAGDIMARQAAIDIYAMIAAAKG